MSCLTNPLITVQKLQARSTTKALPLELQECIIYHTSRLTQAAGILLRLPQDTTARAIVLLQRYLSESGSAMINSLQDDFNITSAAMIYLSAKISASPRSTRSVTNVYRALTAVTDEGSLLYPSLNKPYPTTLNRTLHCQTESQCQIFKDRILLLERKIANRLGFDTHVALPHALSITYLQALDVFSPAYPDGLGRRLTKRAIKHLNTALLSPQLLYLTHQPNALAVAAIYLAARDEHVCLTDEEWWEVFDVDREELGFMVVAMSSLEGWIEQVFNQNKDSMSFSKKTVDFELRSRGLIELTVDDEMEYLERLTSKRNGNIGT